MKDIDFDELDRAVSSVMGSSKEAPAPPSPSVQEKPPAPDHTTEAIPVTITSKVQPDEPAKAVVTKRPGRFMDMVNAPSGSKARPSPTTQTTPAPASREGLTIAPRNNTDAVEAVRTSAPEPDLPIPKPAPVVAPTVEKTDEPAAAISQQPPVAADESPFLSDAKVEKRPLNADGQHAELNTLSQDLEAELQSADAEPEVPVLPSEKAQDEPPATPNVPELDSDLVAIESSETTETDTATQAVDTSHAAKDVQEPAPPLGSTSISPQYTPQPSTGDQSHAAIYDASQYPEPVSHPAKKKSGWLWVLWVVLLLGVGAGGALGLYALGLIP